MTVTLRKPTSPAYRNFSEEVKRRAGNDSFTYGEDEVSDVIIACMAPQSNGKFQWLYLVY